MRFAYRDVGEGREQDAEASQAQHILRIWLDLTKKNIFATESTEEHEKISIKEFIFPCFSVDSVAITQKYGNRYCQQNPAHDLYSV